MNRTEIARRIGWGLIWTSLLIFAFLGYQLVVTDLLNDRVQAAAQEDLDTELAARREALPAPEAVTVELEPEPEPVPESEASSPPITSPPVDYVAEQPGEEGSTLGRMVISKIGVDEVMFAGVSRETLKKGPGHMPGTPVPGQPGNAVVSGHRTTYGRPFYDLDQLETGDRIEVETAAGTHVFEVRRTLIVLPTDVFVTKPRPGAWLTLTTCHPRFSAAQRLVVQAELVSGPNVEYADLLAERATTGEENT